jgi:hypothetical protein
LVSAAEESGNVSDELSIPRPGYAGRRPRAAGLDAGTRRLLMIAGGIVAGAVVVAGGANMMRHRSAGEVPVVQADNRPIRVKPENPGGLQVAGVGNDIFSGGNDTDGSKLAPPPEVPNPKALMPPAAPPVAASVASPMAAPTAPPTTASPGIAAAPPAAPVVREPVVAPRVAPHGGTHEASARSAAAKPVQPAPLAKPAPLPAAVAEKHPAPTGTTTTTGTGKGAAVQLAALSSEDAAKSEWQLLVKRMPDLLGSHQPSFAKTERDGRTYWRVRTGGFGDVAQARAFCDKVRGKGGGCTVADF